MKKGLSTNKKVDYLDKVITAIKSQDFVQIWDVCAGTGVESLKLLYDIEDSEVKLNGDIIANAIRVAIAQGCVKERDFMVAFRWSLRIEVLQKMRDRIRSEYPNAMGKILWKDDNVYGLFLTVTNAKGEFTKMLDCGFSYATAVKAFSQR